jgi:pyridinium-3,5-bisthiocarboxylic acid mononucleotide nickel chelatase
VKILYYDCFAGISGDMNLGALIDLGVDAAWLEQELGKLGISGFRLRVEKDSRKGISGTRAEVIIDNPENQKHRHLHHIEKIINDSFLSDSVKSRSLKIFGLIADAEAAVHNIPVERVHFHEVGALDSIVDIVGCAISQEYFGVDAIFSSPVQLGGGIVDCAHGRFPVPAPATAGILKNIPVKAGLVEYEATTPTGAAILAATVDSFTGSAPMVVNRIGYGIGQKDGTIPNVLRVYLAETEGSNATAGDLEVEEAIMLECNIDDMNPEWFSHISELLFDAGAAEVFTTPVTMKKSRPATLLSVLCRPGSAFALKELILTQTSTIGMREYPVRKSMLRREMVTVMTRFGKVQVKRSFLGERVVHEKPEFDQCSRLARENGITLEEVQKEIIRSL